MQSRFEIVSTYIEGLKILIRKPIIDVRGYLERMFCEEDLSFILVARHIVQINHTYSAIKGSIRGLHFQYPPYAEMKFVTCIKGEVFDVAVDIRKGSPTFLKWHAEILSQDNFKTFVIPEGFAHGFQTLTDNCEMLYFHTCFYNPQAESGLNYSDPLINIKWPITITDISNKDANYSFISPNFEGIIL